MSSSNPPIIQIYPSRMLRMLLLFLPIAAILCIWSLPLDWIIKLGISFFIFLIASQFFYRFANYKSPQAIVALGLQEQKWILVRKDGTQISVQLLPKSLIYRSVFLLHFSNARGTKKYPVLIFPDQINAAARRWLYVYLTYYQAS